MTNLQCRKSQTVYQCHTDIERGLYYTILRYVAAKQHDSAESKQNYTCNIPWFPLTDSSIKFVRTITDQGSRNPVYHLPNQYGISCRLNKQHFFEKIQQIVEPACGGEIIKSMSYCVSPNMMFGESIKGILVFCRLCGFDFDIF